jgi:hypothetical protein
MTGNGNLRGIPWTSVLWKSGWDIGTGFCLGLGDPSNRQWLTYYYCFRTEYPRVELEEIKDHERELRWRVFYKEPMRAGHSFLKPMVFTEISNSLSSYVQATMGKRTIPWRDIVMNHPRSRISSSILLKMSLRR